MEDLTHLAQLADDLRERGHDADVAVVVRTPIDRVSLVVRDGDVEPLIEADGEEAGPIAS